MGMDWIVLSVPNWIEILIEGWRVSSLSNTGYQSSHTAVETQEGDDYQEDYGDDDYGQIHHYFIDLGGILGIEPSFCYNVHKGCRGCRVDALDVLSELNSLGLRQGEGFEVDILVRTELLDIRISGWGVGGKDSARGRERGTECPLPAALLAAGIRCQNEYLSSP
jgi:hypothetical protein